MAWLAKIFTWWNGATIGTLLFSWRNGVKVGEDAAGNRYYRSRDGKRRWVIYTGANDASYVSPEWHGWLHATHDALPDEALPPVREWQGDPSPNLTGTPTAYRPSGSLDRGGRRAAAAGDYQAWTPDAP